MKLKDAVFSVIGRYSTIARGINLLLFLVLLTVPAAVRAQDYSTTIGYSVVRGQTNYFRVITRYSGPGGDVSIPSTIGNFPVAAIDDGAFSGKPSIQSITVPIGIKNIGNYAFSYCSNLTSVSINDPAAQLGEGVFYQCTSLRSFTFPSAVRAIPNSTFEFCTNLTNVTLPSIYIASIGDSAFNHCTSLASITLPPYLTTIGDRAFTSCTNLASITIPNSVTTIGESAFEECTRLTSVAIPTRATSIGNFVFYNCTGLTNVSIPANYATIGYASFSYCGNLTSVTISNGVTGIGGYVFYCCTNLASVTMPNSLTQIGDAAFANCAALNNVLIPTRVKNLGSYAFYNCTSLSGISVPGSIANISYSAFASCSNLTSVTLSNGVVSLEAYAFSDCTSLTNISLPNTMKQIGETAFYDCPSLNSITIPANVASIGSYAFSDSPNLTAINVSTLNTNYCSVDGVLFNKARTALIQFPSGRTGSYTLPTSVLRIATGAFYSSSLTNITVPASVTNISGYAFSQCPELTDIIFKGKPPVIDPSVFDGDDNLTVYYYSSATGWGSMFGGCPTVCIDVTSPVLTVSYPPSTGLRASNAVYELIAKGTVKENVGTSNVLFRVGNGEWTSATTANDWTNWSAVLPLTPGTNKLQTYCVDTAANLSATTTVNFVYVPLAALTVTNSGMGKFSPAFTNGQLLTVGAPYTVTATGTGGYVFSNWSGTCYSPSNVVKFTMTPTTVLGAEFIPNPFASIAGDYWGLFVPQSGMTTTNSGGFSATVTANGTYSGKLYQGATNYPLSGRLQFTLAGLATNTVTINKTKLTVILNLIPDNDGQINGTVSSTAWTADLNAVRNPYSTNNKSPYAGRYTMVVPGSTNADPTLPAGYGVAAVSVSPTGTMSVQGYAADGTAINCGPILSHEGRWPLYASLGGSGFLIGWPTLSRTNDNAVEGSVNWVKPAGTALYPAGFNYLATNIFGSVYTNQFPLLDLTNATLMLTDGNLANDFSTRVSLIKTNVTDLNKTNALVVTMTPTTGLFSGSITNRPAKKTIPFKGVLLQNENVGVGAFKGTNQTGEVFLGVPQP